MNDGTASRFVVVLKPRGYEDESGVTVSVPSLRCITEGDTTEETLAKARDAIGAYLESPASRGLAVPASDEITASVEVASR
jgi:predicted RNase H-like HicB family nuclease